MTRHLEWFVNLDRSKRSTIQFVDNKVIQVEGTKNVLVTR